MDSATWHCLGAEKGSRKNWEPLAAVAVTVVITLGTKHCLSIVDCYQRQRIDRLIFRDSNDSSSNHQPASNLIPVLLLAKQCTEEESWLWANMAVPLVTRAGAAKTPSHHPSPVRPSLGATPAPSSCLLRLDTGWLPAWSTWLFFRHLPGDSGTTLHR